jgi:type 1 glutamine amidotransferase
MTIRYRRYRRSHYMKKIVFQTGGPFHPVDAQAKLIQSWLPSDWKIRPAFGTEAFEQLADADLYVAGGLHWTVLNDLSALIGSDPEPPIWESAGIKKHPYIAPTEAQKSAFGKYVQSGRPILAFHSGILSYNDWPEYGQLLGFRWEMGITEHTLYAGWKVKINSSHPIVRGVPDYELMDELYYNVQVEAGMNAEMHAYAEFGPEKTRPVKFPMVITGTGGRIAGAGKTAYLANGHSMKTFECAALRPLWMNTLKWLLAS